MRRAPELDDRAPDGWGLASAAATPQEADAVRAGLAARFGGDAIWGPSTPPPPPPPSGRVTVPDALAGVAHRDPSTLVLHAVGRSFADVVALRETGVTALPDVVVTTRDEDEVEAVLDWCHADGLACIPFGGGTSVVGGVDVAGVGGDRGVVVLQTRAMDRVQQIDPVSRAALIQGGATGPKLEQQLKAHGLTLRFFPQSFEMSTLGGWIATRAGGHFATGPVHIDDLVESISAVTPSGRWSSRRLPGSGAGPSPDRMLMGSEGTIGVITDAWVRVQPPPAGKGSVSVRFDDLATGLRALRSLVQSGLRPSNCRVLDPVEAALNGAGDGSHAVMVLGAESPDRGVDAELAAMVEVVQAHGGVPGTARLSRPGDAPSPGGSPEGGAGASADQAWKRSFIRAPYLRDVMVDAGMVIETVETAMTYDRLEGYVADLLAATTAAVHEVCGDGIVTCRITHAYPDGAAPYLTVIAPGRRGARADQWREIKAAASEVVVAAGGTITHHHAVGRDHRPWYDRQRPDVFAMALRGARAAVDPEGILNPGVLL
jgi:alkyldihydroxyacetonephosphate synthase